MAMLFCGDIRKDSVAVKAQFNANSINTGTVNLDTIIVLNPNNVTE